MVAPEPVVVAPAPVVQRKSWADQHCAVNYSRGGVEFPPSLGNGAFRGMDDYTYWCLSFPASGVWLNAAVPDNKREGYFRCYTYGRVDSISVADNGDVKFVVGREDTVKATVIANSARYHHSITRTEDETTQAMQLSLVTGHLDTATLQSWADPDNGVIEYHSNLQALSLAEFTKLARPFNAEVPVKAPMLSHELVLHSPVALKPPPVAAKVSEQHRVAC